MKALTVFFLLLALAGAGCGRPSTPAAPQTASSPPSSPQPMPNPMADVPPPPAPPNGAPTTPTSAPSVSTPAAVAKGRGIDFATSQRPVDSSGRPLTDLEWLNQIVDGYSMLASMPGTDLPEGRFNSQDEEIAAQQKAAEKRAKRMEFHSLADLVKTGVIKAIPEAPSGKKYVLDQKTGKVLLVGQ